MIEPGATQTILLRLVSYPAKYALCRCRDNLRHTYREADEFYRAISTAQTDDERAVQRQALAGLLWSKQFFYYDVDQWLRGDPAGPPPPPQRSRNKGWRHLSNFDIVHHARHMGISVVCRLGPGFPLYCDGADR